MHLRRIQIENVRTISSLDMTFEKDQEAGWHVILGQNGSGKSSFVRAFALAMMGPREVFASGQIYSEWLRNNARSASVVAQVSRDDVFDLASGRPSERPVELRVEMSVAEPVSTDVSRAPSIDVVPRFSPTSGRSQSVWSPGTGWFSASFGPFRRFTGGDPNYERAFLSNPRLAPHLTALSESVALREARRWLTDLHVRTLQERASGGSISVAARTLEIVKEFLNASGFFPHGALIDDITVDHVILRDGNGNTVPMDQMSDGYRSALSLTLELLRQMFEVYGFERMSSQCQPEDGRITAPGVVAIDEVDAHLHPTWQRDIGRWLTRCFPNVQFIVTTHSPLVCRAVANGAGEIRGSVWLLPSPGTENRFSRVEGAELDRLLFGDILDAYDTHLFGTHVVRSQAGQDKLTELARLNVAELERDLTAGERQRQSELRDAFPGEALLLGTAA